jgi:hypothetical protein
LGARCFGLIFRVLFLFEHLVLVQAAQLLDQRGRLIAAMGLVKTEDLQSAGEGEK